MSENIGSLSTTSAILTLWWETCLHITELNSVSTATINTATVTAADYVIDTDTDIDTETDTVTDTITGTDTKTATTTGTDTGTVTDTDPHAITSVCIITQKLTGGSGWCDWSHEWADKYNGYLN